jgi:hypothetical protein
MDQFPWDIEPRLTDAELDELAEEQSYLDSLNDERFELYAQPFEWSGSAVIEMEGDCDGRAGVEGRAGEDEVGAARAAQGDHRRGHAQRRRLGAGGRSSSGRQEETRPQAHAQWRVVGAIAVRGGVMNRELVADLVTLVRDQLERMATR